ncbi:MAG: phosphoglycolate phosphatase [Micropepsaceae bacterium]
MTNRRAIIFDLDGTLVDTAPDLTAALNAVLRDAGHRTFDTAELRSLVGFGVRRLFERAFERTGTAISEEELLKYSDEFLRYYRANIAKKSRPYPRVTETLLSLADEGFHLGVCTNKPHDLTELLLDELDLARHFGAVVGAGNTAHNKPDPGHILDVVRALEANVKRTVMVGDSAVDVAAAKAAEIPVIVMSYGYTTEPAHMLGADALTGEFADVPALVAKLLS